MKITKAAGLITASVIAFSSVSSITAGAVTFTEGNNGVKTWNFTVNGKDKYPEGVKVKDNGDAVFEKDKTYYASNGWTTDPSSEENKNNYLVLTVNNEQSEDDDVGTYESNGSKAIYLNSSHDYVSSTLTYTAPVDGEISITAFNYKNDIGTIWLKAGGETLNTGGNVQTVSTDVIAGETITITADKWDGLQEVKFTPSGTHSVLYSFTETADELNGKTLVVTTSDGQKKSAEINAQDSTTHVAGRGEVKLGIIINNIPNNVTIQSVVIE